jgi:hypothetical protein
MLNSCCGGPSLPAVWGPGSMITDIIWRLSISRGEQNKRSNSALLASEAMSLNSVLHDPTTHAF